MTTPPQRVATVTTKEVALRETELLKSPHRDRR